MKNERKPSELMRNARYSGNEKLVTVTDAGPRLVK